MNFLQAQENMDFAYNRGGTGVLASGIIWMIAAVIGWLTTPFTSMLTLFFGGMFIHPLGMLLSKLLKRPGNHSADNPLGKLAIETTFLLFVGLFIAFNVAQIQLAWFYPIMLMVIGGRYLMFQTLYGAKIYWVLGAVLILIGGACMLLGAPFIVGAFVGGGLEVLFGLFILAQARSTQMSPA